MIHPGWPAARLTLAVLLASAAPLSACTTPNPLDCADGTCTDPAHPFCDADGAVAGTPSTCIAVSCTPGSFAACRADGALVCNAAGTSYDLTQCADGCDATAGCRLCEANQTVCANGTVQTCDASGAVVSSQTCALGCFQDEPRCQDITPSNDLVMYLDMAATAPDITLVDGDTVYTDANMLAHAGAQPIPLPFLSFLTIAAPGGVPIRVLVGNHVQITGKVQVRSQTFTVPGPALAIVANGEISIDGKVGFGHSDYDETPPPGSVTTPDCVGSPGVIHGSGYSGGGGGGHATAGGHGGSVGESPVVAAGGKAGAANGNPTLIPLRGGCSGGSDPSTGGYTGGGALQLSSRAKIVLGSDAILDLNGHAGPMVGGYGASSGGGAGGGLLMEAPIVELGDAARLLVNGGPGVLISGPRSTSLTTMPSLGTPCIPEDEFVCSSAGNGAAIGGPATDGGSTPYSDSSNQLTFMAGGGGGGLGYIRINTADGNYTKASSTIESGVLTTGAIGTR